MQENQMSPDLFYIRVNPAFKDLFFIMEKQSCVG